MSDNKDEKNSVPVTSKAISKSKDDKKKTDLNLNELSDEDQRIKDEVQLLVTRSQDEDASLAVTAIGKLADMLRTATGTVASIPKPLKYIRPFFQELLSHAEKIHTKPHAKQLYDVLALIAMTLELPDSPQEVLRLKKLGNQDDLHKWGFEFLRRVAGDVATEWQNLVDEEKSTDGLNSFVEQIISFMMQNQDEPSACDMVMEIGETQRLLQYVGDSNYGSVCQYLIAIAKYLPSPDDTAVINVVYDIYIKVKALPSALLIALSQRSTERVTEVFNACDDDKIKKQMAFMCGRCRFFHTTDDDELDELIGNCKMSEQFLHSAKDLDSIAPKTHEEIYKEHLMEKNQLPQTTNSHMHNLASTFVNCFANAGFAADKLLTDQATSWIYQTKEHRMMSATASLGMIHLWDSDGGLAAVDRYSYAEENYIKAGSLLAVGLVMCGIRSPFDPAYGLLADYTSNVNRDIRIGAILGLGFAYAASEKEDVKDLLIPLLADANQPMEIQCFAAYALALVYVGSCDPDVCEATMMCIMDKTPTVLQESCTRYLILALCLLFLGAQDSADAMLEAVKTLPTEIQKFTEVLLIACAFAGTCNVVVVQKLFNYISEKEDSDLAAAEEKEKKEKKDEDDADGAAKEKEEEEKSFPPMNHKSVAAMGIGLVSMGEDLGASMSKRALLHALLSKEDVSKSGRRGVPLALALLSVADPNMPTVENLSKLSHDSDPATAQAAMMGMGIVSAGTNNARVATMLRNLSGYYSKDNEHNHLFIVRIAQGLLHLGKGHITITPRTLDKNVLNPAALAGLVTLTTSALDMQNTILDKYHYMLFSVVLAANPRMLLTVDSELEPVPTEVRVGMGLDTVALPGKHKTITGFQTHKTPVLMSGSERAELVPGKHMAHAPVLEGVVVISDKPKTAEQE